MAATKRYFPLFLELFFLLSVCCLPEPGKKQLKFSKQHHHGGFPKTMNKGYTVAMKGQCSGYKGKIFIKWRLAVSPCAEMFSPLEDGGDDSGEDRVGIIFDSGYANHSLNGNYTVDCKAAIHFADQTDTVIELIQPSPSVTESQEKDQGTEENQDEKNKTDEKEKADTEQEKKKKPVHTDENEGKKGKDSKGEEKPDPDVSEMLGNGDGKPQKTSKRRKRDANDKPEASKPQAIKQEASKPEVKTSKSSTASSTTKGSENSESSKKSSSKSSSKKPKKTGTTKKKTEEKVVNRICQTKRDGVFVLVIEAIPVNKLKEDEDFDLSLDVEMKGKNGYLSASDWPLYPVSGKILWHHVTSLCVLWPCVADRFCLPVERFTQNTGMLEKAVFFSEYNNINITGVTNPGLTVFAELVSCVKRTLARILVIIVSMGFGIVKPRLGSTLHRVLGVGALYFILATIEGCFRALRPKSDPGRQQLIASIPLAVLDASICWWIFMSLVQTTRTLRIRRNLVKLSLYRHFTNTLIFAVLASVAYMIWSIKTHRFSKANNQRYAFTPIVDFGDEEDEDENMTLSDAFDGMKMRNVKNTPEVIINGDMKRKHKPEDDLKWVEENIPSSAADAVLPSVLDSDEELMTTKFEMSKME
ncbi:hypothetical protein pdam_00018885 [Pocillopora damicornis]|uniref:GOST seven transmembrane domain-containing protein n=1 Tax=Pocillopora damicornis TaxID=46731 RepID=A0A3M6UHD1_POCDA|nr:hypothetical protein pdam_00018885 [Pocillopora damicornis]